MKIRHLSPSALEAWDYCPEHRYAASYRDRKPMEPNIPVWFGLSIHEAAEAFYRGKDWEAIWYQVWATKYAQLEKANVVEGKSEYTRLANRGFALLDELVKLKIPGAPEVGFQHTVDPLTIPFKGRIDLVDTVNHRLWDFKTANYAWTQKRADAKVWQPAIYSTVYKADYGVWPTFGYIVLPLTGAPRAIVLDRVMSEEDAQRAMVHAAAIHERILADDFPCYCPASRAPKSADGEGELPVRKSTKMFNAA